MKIILLRHGTRNYGIGDSPLNEEGLEEAQALTTVDDLLSCQKIFSSPKKRAQMTVTPLSEKLGLGIQTLNDLDQKLSEESYDEFKKRVEKTLTRLLELADGQNIVACSHSDWLAEAMGLIPTDMIDPETHMFHCADYIVFKVEDGPVEKTVNSVGTIWAIGRNYANHAKEMNSEIPSSPVVFLKSPHCLSTKSQIELPTWSNDVHHEAEIGILLGEGLQPEMICVALDLTARDVQKELKDKKLPWAKAKSFTQSCPVSPFVPYESQEWFESLSIELKIADTIRQFGKTSDMIFSIPFIIDYLKNHFPVLAGDLILTGTPEGVGPLQKGDSLRCEIPGVLSMDWTISK